MKKIVLFLSVLLMAAQAYAADTVLKGTIYDSSGESVIGAAVLVNGDPSTAVISDIDGNFSIEVSVSDTLTISCMGFETLDYIVKDMNPVKITLQVSSYMLDELVVVGYGSVKKSDMTGSVSSIKTDLIDKIPSSDIGSLIQGRTAGLQVSKSSDDPSEGVKVRIRGASSIVGSREPLVVVDGVPMGSMSKLTQFTASDIESIEVLKDASSASIFGSQGANGVILITTKLGSENKKPEITFDFNTSVGQYTKKFDRWTDMIRMAELSNLMYENSNMEPRFVGKKYNGFYYPSIDEFKDGTYKFNDWLPYTTKLNPITYNAKFNLTGGSKMNRYNFTISEYNTDKMVKGGDYNKVNILFNDSIDITKKLNFRFSANYSYISQNFGTGDDYTNGGRPWYQPFNEDGSFYYPEGISNYYHQLEAKADNYNKSKEMDMSATAEVTWKILPWLTFKSAFGYTDNRITNDYYLKAKYTLLTSSNKGLGKKSTSIYNQTYWSNFITASKKFNENHDLSVMIGTDDLVKKNTFTEIVGKDFPNDVLFTENMGMTTPENQTFTDTYTSESLKSWFGRINYSLMDRYLFTFNVRADGSSKFGANNKWAWFPAGAFAWKMDNEPFLKDNKVVSSMKLRFSVGMTGNQGISPYESHQKYGYTTVHDWASGNNIVAIGPTVYDEWNGYVGAGNPDLRWETTTQYNLGYEFSLFDSRLKFNLDTYYKHTTDLLRRKLLPLSSGYTSMMINDGVVDNYGFEMELGYDIIRKEDMFFTASLMMSMNKNRIVDIGSGADSGLVTDEHGNKFVYGGAGVYAIGHSLEAIYGYEGDGVINSKAEKKFGYGAYTSYGDMKYKDLNGNGMNDEGDRTIIADLQPLMYGSLNLTFQYKHFDINALFYGVIGKSLYDSMLIDRPSAWEKRWRKDNQEAEWPRLLNTDSYPISSLFVVNGSYLRLDNLSLGYNVVIPRQKVFQTGRVYMNMNNLFCIHSKNFHGYDPEFNGDTPRMRSFTLGIQLTF